MNDVIQNVKIRSARLQDLESIMYIENECFDKDTLEDNNVYINRIKSFADGFLVLEYQDEIIGCVSSEIWNYSNEISVDLFELGHDITKRHSINGNELYISSIAILPKYQGLGLGTLLFKNLIESIINKYSNIKSLILIVSKKWLYAQRIYNNYGFKTIMIFENFFGCNNVTRSDGIVMRKSI